MKFTLLVVSMVAISLAFPMIDAFPYSYPYQWNGLPSGSDYRVRAYGSPGSAGNLYVAGQRALDNNWDVRGKVGTDWAPGYSSQSVDVGTGYNNDRTRFGASVGMTGDNFGVTKRAGVSVDQKIGENTHLSGTADTHFNSHGSRPTFGIGLTHKF